MIIVLCSLSLSLSLFLTIALTHNQRYSRFSNSEDCSEILCRLGNFLSHHYTRILAEEVWPDLIMENNDRKTSIPCLQSLVESTLFQNFPRRVVSQNLRDDSSEEEKRKIAWMRTLPLDHFGFSAPKSAMKMLNQMIFAQQVVIINFVKVV